MFCGKEEGWDEYFLTNFEGTLNKIKVHPTIDRVWHIPPRFLFNQGKGNIVRKDTATFCVIRDPYDRLLSQYRFVAQKYRGRPLRSGKFIWGGGSGLQWKVISHCPYNATTGSVNIFVNICWDLFFHLENMILKVCVE